MRLSPLFQEAKPMSQPNLNPLTQAQEYIRDKQLPKAQRLLVDYIKKNPNSEQAWYLLSTAVTDPAKQMECLQRVLRLNPANAEAQTRMMQAMATSNQAEEPEPPAESLQPPIATAAASTSFAAPPVAPDKAAPLTAESAQTDSTQAQVPATPVPLPAKPPAAPSSEAAADADLSSLRSKIKAPKVKKPRKRGPRIIILLLLVLLASALGTYFLLGRNAGGGAAPQTSTAAVSGGATKAPTATPTATTKPTATLTPSITPTRFPPTWTPTPLPTLPPTRTPTPLPPLAPTVEAELQVVQDQVADLRGLTALADVPTSLLSRENAEAVLKAVVNHSAVQPELQNQSRALALLGLVRPAYDITRYTLNSFADSEGFYVPWHKVLYLLGDQVTARERRAYAGELEQALIDQNFHSDEWGWSPVCQLTQQSCQALRALLKGSALLTAEQWVEKAASKADKQDLEEYQPPALALPDDGAPLFVLRDLAFASAQGLAFVKDLYQQGGWEGVNEVLKSPPLSTEQLLDAQKYVEGEKPIELAAMPLTETLGSGWQSIANNSLGEWRTYLLLSTSVDEAARLSDETARQAAKGWGGDRYQAYVNDALGQNVLAAEWAWDTPQDAAEFKQALNTYLDLRFRGAKDPQAENCWAANRQVTCVFTTEQGTLWLLAPTRALIDQVRQQFTAYR